MAFKVGDTVWHVAGKNQELECQITRGPNKNKTYDIKVLHSEGLNVTQGAVDVPPSKLTKNPMLKYVTTQRVETWLVASATSPRGSRWVEASINKVHKGKNLFDLQVSNPEKEKVLPVALEVPRCRIKFVPEPQEKKRLFEEMGAVQARIGDFMDKNNEFFKTLGEVEHFKQVASVIGAHERVHNAFSKAGLIELGLNQLVSCRARLRALKVKGEIPESKQDFFKKQADELKKLCNEKVGLAARSFARNIQYMVDTFQQDIDALRSILERLHKISMRCVTPETVAEADLELEFADELRSEVFKYDKELKSFKGFVGILKKYGYKDFAMLNLDVESLKSLYDGVRKKTLDRIKLLKQTRKKIDEANLSEKLAELDKKHSDMFLSYYEWADERIHWVNQHCKPKVFEMSDKTKITSELDATGVSKNVKLKQMRPAMKKWKNELRKYKYTKMAEIEDRHKQIENLSMRLNEAIVKLNGLLGKKGGPDVGSNKTNASTGSRKSSSTTRRKSRTKGRRASKTKEGRRSSIRQSLAELSEAVGNTVNWLMGNTSELLSASPRSNRSWRSPSIPENAPMQATA